MYADILRFSYFGGVGLDRHVTCVFPVAEQGKDISDDFPITFCERIEAVLALMHVRPMFEIMTADNSALRVDAMQPGNQGNALFARINLDQIKAQNHLADMVRIYIYICRGVV